jgi:glycerophosphoryl diester phosphodiesterase
VGGDGYLSPPRPRVLAHRGLALDAPENTLLAFERAVAAGTTYIETDVHASRDGVAVVSHDPDLQRVAGRPGRVGDLTLDELREIDLGHGQTFCTLAEALAAHPTIRFNIDVKSADAVESAATAILDAAATDRVLVTSFGESRRARVTALLPGVATSASARRFLVALLAGKIGAVGIMRAALRGMCAVQVPERAVGLRVTSPAMIRRLHEAGVEVHVWTINDPTRMRELLDLGVDGIVTDRADLALAVVAAL